MTGDLAIGSDVASPAARRRQRREAGILALVAVAAAAGYFWGIAGFRREHAHHQVRDELRRIEKALRAGTGIAFWMYVEAEDSDQGDPAEHARHKAILEDFDRLARMDGLSFADVEVDVDVRGDDAVVRFRVTSKNPGRAPAPVRAELTFRRRTEDWRLSSSRLFER